MDCIRIYTDAAGETHFEDTALDLSRETPGGFVLSEVIATPSTVFFEAPDGLEYDWHPAPNRRFLFVVSGALEVQVSDGEVRTIRPGDVALVEDTTGKGHSTRVPAGQTTYGAFVHLE